MRLFVARFMCFFFFCFRQIGVRKYRPRNDSGAKTILGQKYSEAEQKLGQSRGGGG